MKDTLVELIHGVDILNVLKSSKSLNPINHGSDE